MPLLSPSPSEPRIWPCTPPQIWQNPPQKLKGTFSGQSTITIGHHERGSQLVVSDVAGRMWSALEGSNIVYPTGPHDMALTSQQEWWEAGVGVGMRSLGSGVLVEEEEWKEFDWMDFW